MGEAKDSDRVRTAGDVARLERVRDLMVAKGRKAGEAKLLLFGRSGFSPDVVEAAAGRDDLELIDLDRIRWGS